MIASNACRKPGLPAPRSCSATSGAGRRPAWRTASDSVSSRSRARRATASDLDASPAAEAASIRSPRVSTGIGLLEASRGLIGASGSRVEMPAGEISTSRSTRCGNAIASSAAMKPPIELPTTAAASMPELSEQPVQQPRVAAGS